METETLNFNKVQRETHGCFISMYDKIHYKKQKHKQKQTQNKVQRVLEEGRVKFIVQSVWYCIYVTEIRLGVCILD